MSLSKQDFDYVRGVVRDKAAIVLDDSKEYLVELRLSNLASMQGLPGVTELIRDVRDNGNRPLADLMVEAMTTNETSFFRDGLPFDAMRESILPELLQARAEQRSLKIWCAAASTGQESYSLAMLVRQCLQGTPDWDIRILGTDISPEVLTRAESGVYSQHEVSRGVPAESLVTEFQREGLDWVVRDDLKTMCEFRRMNLVGSWSGLPTFDVIFLRNVLIYFDTDVRRKILERAKRHLAPDGYLFLGGSETLLGLDLDQDFTRVLLGSASAYQVTT
ncbi:MAG: methyltransferase domain-containing protein [Planctomycetota bacterium]|nr:methyltransferase domain-containing protein [Planctomycetota bacterium]